MQHVEPICKTERIGLAIPAKLILRELTIGGSVNERIEKSRNL